MVRLFAKGWWDKDVENYLYLGGGFSIVKSNTTSITDVMRNELIFISDDEIRLYRYVISEDPRFEGLELKEIFAKK